MLKRKTHTEGRITAESCICCFVLIFVLLLSIQLNGYIKAHSDLLSELDRRLVNGAVAYHASGIYLVDVITQPEETDINNAIFFAVPYDDFFTLSVFADYSGILKKNRVYVRSVSSKWAGDGKGVVKENIWELDPLERGQVIHKMMGANLDHNFPTLDIYDGYTKEAVSIVSINTQEDSYKSGTELKRKIKKHIDSMDKFTYGEYKGYSVSGEDIREKTVLVVIPNAKLTGHQTKQINDMFKYAKKAGINLEIKKFQ
ncbi:MAG TPA: hypothetical protein P5064_08475 [Clostridia bacterium]|jgi:hypothetical protein|nr:hypothetical protein [Clostridiaceae bacterium]HOF26349.1 hypothetical protein [Clostridia bacterium]HOM34245.1 hypothetical protein [Clostridia bacterium]HOR89708.1 hypothetical protein [Clostridia bacterium]HOT70845.1 hypothetical protein [Clostridia bacterium]